MHAAGTPIKNKFKVSHKKYLLPMELLLCTTSISWLLFIVLLLISLLTPVFLQREKDKRLIKHPPSPPMLSTIKTIFRIHLFGLPQLFLWRLSKKYGSMVLLRLGCLPTLIVSSAEIAKEIMKTQDFNFCSRPPLVSTRRFSNNFIDVAVAPYSEYWREMRKIYVLKVMSIKSVHSYRCVREEEVSIVINSIRSSKSSSSSRTPMVNLDEKLFSLTINIFFRVLFGKSRQARMTIGGYTFEEVVRDVTQTIGCLSAADLIPYIGWVIDVITGKHARLEKDYHGFYSFMEHFISEYLDPNMAKSKINEAMIDTLFELEGRELRGIIVTREHIKAVLGDIFGGGIDTSYVTMVWAMAELVKNPRIMKKVQDEVRSCVAKKGKVDESDLDLLQYLKMVVKETLRLHPPAPLLMPRECMKQTKVNGYDICPKTMVLVNVWALGRDPKSWVNPEVFYPERFMDSSIDFRGQHFELLPFGAGRRGCPGISMGNAIMELTLANLLYSFNWELPSGMKTEDLDMEEAGTFMLHKKSGLQLVPIAYDMQSIKESC